MIIMYLGNVGSGKTANAVREMIIDKSNTLFYTNILVKKKTDRIKKLLPEYIIKKEQVKVMRSKDGVNVPVYDYSVNMDFWKRHKRPICIFLDEFHNIASSRTFMSKKNRVFNIWLTMIRRVLGSASSGMGDLVLISQLSNQVDIIARQLSHQIRYHVCHFSKTCENCGYSWGENSDLPEQLRQCPSCGSWEVKKHSHRVEVMCFFGMPNFTAWKEFGMNSYYSHYMVNDIEDYFDAYDSLQWDNLFEDY